MRLIPSIKISPADEEPKFSLVILKQLPNSKRAELTMPIHSVEEMGASAVANSANKKEPRF